MYTLQVTSYKLLHNDYVFMYSDVYTTCTSDNVQCNCTMNVLLKNGLFPIKRYSTRQKKVSIPFKLIAL